MHALRRTAYILATGYILFFYSERLFWTVFRPTDTVADTLITWLAYCAPAYLFLALLQRFHIRHAGAVFLAGAVYGWLIEGCLAPTLYGTEPSAPFPVSLLCTAVSWHALISVWVGWYLVPQALRQRRHLQTLLLAVGIGVFWGLWAPFQWLETPAVVTSVPSFLGTGLLLTVLLVLSYGLAGGPAAAEFRPRRWGLALALAVPAVFFAQHLRTLGLRPLLILPALLLPTLAVLERYRRRQGDDATPTPAPAPRQVMPQALLLLAAPLTATLVYALARTAGPRWPPCHTVIFPATIVLGGIALLISVVLTLRERPLPSEHC